jgi:hypothetical protein
MGDLLRGRSTAHLRSSCSISQSTVEGMRLDLKVEEEEELLAKTSRTSSIPSSIP